MFIGNDYLIIVNTNQITIPVTAQYVNGAFMELWQTTTTSTATDSDWETYKDSLVWLQENCMSPVITCLETWYHTSRTSPSDLARMRATTTLSLTLSNGFALFSDPNELDSRDHLHDWYTPFWDKSLGKAAGDGVEKAGGYYQREFDNGTVIFNPPLNTAQTINFSESRKKVSTGETGTSFQVQNLDGEIFLYQ